MTWVGFQMLKDGSRVFVKTSSPADYNVVEAGPNKIVLELQNTFIQSKLNRRPLDTAYFPAAVTNIAPRAAKKNVNIEMKLRENVKYTVKQDESTIIIDFAKPLNVKMPDMPGMPGAAKAKEPSGAPQPEDNESP